MTIKVKDELVWEEISHHVLNRTTNEIANLHHAELLYYKNDAVLVHASFHLQEVTTGATPYSLTLVSRINVSPDVLRLEFSETRLIGNYATFEEACEYANYYFYKHLHSKHTNHPT